MVRLCRVDELKVKEEEESEIDGNEALIIRLKDFCCKEHASLR